MDEQDPLENFEGVLIEFHDPFGITGRAPGWRCTICGWTIGSEGLPPPHECPTDGIQQQCQHVWGDDQPSPYNRPGRKRELTCRTCTKCGKMQHRFTDGRWLD